MRLRPVDFEIDSHGTVLAKYRARPRTSKNSGQGVERGARICIIHENWCREMAAPECWHRNSTFLACATRTRRVTYLKGKIVAARPNLEIMLENHTLVGSVDLLERWNSDDLHAVDSCDLRCSL